MQSDGTKLSIDPELQQVDREIRRQLHSLCGDDALLDEIFHAFFRGRGKKLRPKLVLLSAFALRGSELRDTRCARERDALISLAVTSELVHSASLMHDDVLDRALSRRGNESLNACFGDKTAILSGDILYSRVFEMLVEKASRETILMLTSCVRRMCRGEITNLSSHGFEAYTSIIEDKTAALMAFCCDAGAKTVRRDGDAPEAVGSLKQFGYSFGMVYQLTDDLCDADCEAVLRHRDRVVDLLRDFTRSAQEALSAVPDSRYKEDLAELLNYVVKKSKRFTESGAHPRECVLAGASHAIEERG